MKALRNLLDKMEPHFVKGGRYESWYALYEGDPFIRGVSHGRILMT